MAKFVRNDAGQLIVKKRIGETVGKHKHAAAPEHDIRNVVLVKEQIEFAVALVQLKRPTKDFLDAAEQLALGISPFMERDGERRNGLRASVCVLAMLMT